MLLTISAVYRALGGHRKVGALCERSPQNACNWRADGVIPCQHFDAIEKALAELRPPLEVSRDLFSFNRPKRKNAA